jgi:NAD(P)-dependent dehydrogenase (short-subunit alcohol dehydrogenase family)
MDDAAATAVVVGASGGIGSALAERLASRFGAVVRLSRPSFDLLDETSIAAAAAAVRERTSELRLLIVASGVLMNGQAPEKSWRQLDAETLGGQFAVNAIGPALVLKHFLPLLPRHGRSVAACLSARVGSIGDNQLGGWYGYRASKAALNQFVHTAAVELARTRPEAICVTLHPGTVATTLSRPFVGDGPNAVAPEVAADRLLEVINGLTTANTGGFLDYEGRPVPW